MLPKSWRSCSRAWYGKQGGPRNSHPESSPVSPNHLPQMATGAHHMPTAQLVPHPCLLYWGPFLPDATVVTQVSGARSQATWVSPFPSVSLAISEPSILPSSIFTPPSHSNSTSEPQLRTTELVPKSSQDWDQSTSGTPMTQSPRGQFLVPMTYFLPRDCEFPPTRSSFCISARAWPRTGLGRSEGGR